MWVRFPLQAPEKRKEEKLRTLENEIYRYAVAEAKGYAYNVQGLNEEDRKILDFVIRTYEMLRVRQWITVHSGAPGETTSFFYPASLPLPFEILNDSFLSNLFHLALTTQQQVTWNGAFSLDFVDQE